MSIKLYPNKVLAKNLGTEEEIPLGLISSEFDYPAAISSTEIAGLDTEGKTVQAAINELKAAIDSLEDANEVKY